MLVCRRVAIPLKADHLNVGSNSLPPPCLLCLSAPHGLSLVAGSRPWRILQRPAIAAGLAAQVGQVFLIKEVGGGSESGRSC